MQLWHCSPKRGLLLLALFLCIVTLATSYRAHSLYEDSIGGLGLLNSFFPPNSRESKNQDGPLSSSHWTISRDPIWNGSELWNQGEDPNRRFPCLAGVDQRPHKFSSLGVKYRRIYNYIGRNQILRVHEDEGQFCFVGYDVPNVVFRLVGGMDELSVHVPAVHLPTGLFVGMDTHFHDHLYRNIVSDLRFSSWRKALLQETESFRDNTNISFWREYEPYKDKRIPERVYIDPETLPSTIRELPVKTPYVHLLSIDIVGMMPAVSVAQFISYWAHFYASGIQALGPSQVTVIINNASWGSAYGFKNGILVETFLRYLPVPALYIPENTNFYAKRVTFSPRGYQDGVEPCTFHFLYNYLVPVVVKRMQAALIRGREGSAETEGKTVEIAPGIKLREPINPNREKPWWPKEYDHLIRNPPEGLAILKTRAGAYSLIHNKRILEPTPSFLKLLEDANYQLVSDTSPLDVRLYLLNHAKRLIVLWGGGSTVHSHMWGGGVGKQRRYLDVIMLVHHGYKTEFPTFYSNPLEVHGAKLKQRSFNQSGLEVFIGPPNPHDQWSEGPYAFGYAWTKVIRISDLTKLLPEHIIVSDAEKARNYTPYCRDRLLSELTGRKQREKTLYEFAPQ